MNRTSPTKQAAFRLPTDLIKRIDRYAVRLQTEHTVLFNCKPLTRSDVVRILLTRALDQLDASSKSHA